MAPFHHQAATSARQVPQFSPERQYHPPVPFNGFVFPSLFLFFLLVVMSHPPADVKRPPLSEFFGEAEGTVPL